MSIGYLFSVLNVNAPCNFLQDLVIFCSLISLLANETVNTDYNDVSCSISPCCHCFDYFVHVETSFSTAGTKDLTLTSCTLLFPITSFCCFWSADCDILDVCRRKGRSSASYVVYMLFERKIIIEGRRDGHQRESRVLLGPLLCQSLLPL